MPYRNIEKSRKAVIERRRKLKRMALEYKGGKCSVCGYNRHVAALEFHHMYGKETTIASYGKSWESMKKELDKCILVCANCHREIQYGKAIC